MSHCITFDKVHQFNIDIDEKGDVTERCTICKQIFKHYDKNIKFITLEDQK